MAAGGSDTCASIRHAGSTAHERGPAGPVVAFCRGDRRVGGRVGVAAARGPALMGGTLWERLARVFGRSACERSEAERILLEADFGVEATEEILDRVSGAKDGDHDFRAALERAVIGALTPAAPSVAPGALARGGGIDTVLVDTAGRLHTEERLLEELKKVVRVAARQQPGAPHESLLVLDATVGQNAVHQARAFAAAVPLTGLIVTKLDGTAKGGSVVALERAVQVPIRFLGTGEDLGDLEVFAAERFARRLIGG